MDADVLRVVLAAARGAELRVVCRENAARRAAAGGRAVVNVAINLVLIPAWGLHGAVVATTIATALALAVLYWINHRAGMQLQRGMILHYARAGRAVRRRVVRHGHARAAGRGAAILQNARDAGRTRRRSLSWASSYLRSWKALLVAVRGTNGASSCDLKMQ